MKLILRSNLVKSIQQPYRKQAKKYSKTVTAFVFATVVSGVNYYFQNVVAHNDNKRQKQLIERVASDQTSEKFLENFDYHKADDWQCKKIVLDGSLRQGRFLVKKNRGTQQGYIVLAPFVVQREDLIFRRRRVQRKFVLNMGWIPKSSKHLIKTTTAPDSLGQNDYSQDRIAALQAQKVDNLVRDPLLIEYYTPITTIHAYIRRGEQKQIFNGLNNWRDSKFFKFIDLAWMTRLFRIANREQASTIYLQRIAKTQQQSQIAPMPAKKQVVIDELKNRIELNNQTKSRNIEWVTLGAFGSAALISIL